jgi:hypothetical protein
MERKLVAMEHESLMYFTALSFYDSLSKSTVSRRRA